MRNFVFRILNLVMLFIAPTAFSAGKAEHVVVIVWDGMRPDFITRKHAPTLYGLARNGVLFENHHSIYCTATDVNGTAMATGAYPGNSGIIANNDYFPRISLNKPVVTAFPDVMRAGDEAMGGHFIRRPTMAEAIQAAGKRTAIAGTKLVALMHDRHDRAADSMDICVYEGKSQPPAALAGFTNLLGPFPGYVAGKPRTERDEWTRRALTEILWSKGVPEFSLLWLSEPDASQHASGPGSQLSIDAMASSDRQLAAVLQELDRRKLRDKTDIFVVSDHGFSTISAAVDVAAVLREAGFRAQREFKSPPQRGDVLVISQGGSVLFHVIDRDTEVTCKLVRFLQQQDFAGVMFTREPMPGTFTLDAANINRPDPPDVVLSMRWSDDKSKTGVPGLFIIDGSQPPGRGSHASLSRFDVHNTLVAAGPDLKRGFKDKMPTANTDLAPTILWLLGIKPKEPMDGRVLSEALTVNAPTTGKAFTHRLVATVTNDVTVWQQYLQISRVNGTIYLDEGNGFITDK